MSECGNFLRASRRNEAHKRRPELRREIGWKIELIDRIEVRKEQVVRAVERSMFWQSFAHEDLTQRKIANELFETYVRLKKYCNANGEH